MILPILTEPNPLLRVRAKEMEAEQIQRPEFQKLLDDMTETMYAANGIGLAGPQIGQSKRILIAESSESGDRKPLALINPMISSKSWRKVMSEEGCLSIPGKWGVVKRHRGITVRALDRQGKPLTINSDKLLAIILQHEIDHLDGILFIDKAVRVEEMSERVRPRI